MTAQQQLLAKYGLPGESYQAKYCITWEIKKDFAWFPAEKIFINKDFKDKLFILFSQLQSKGLHTEIIKFDGCYNARDVRGSTKLSLHDWACAIDLNAALNPMIIKPVITDAERLGKWTQEFVDTVRASGIYFGGDFIKRSDPMHLALLDG